MKKIVRLVLFVLTVLVALSVKTNAGKNTALSDKDRLVSNGSKNLSHSLDKYVRLAKWSPDGNKIAILTDSKNGLQIFIVSTDGRVINHLVDVQWPQLYWLDDDNILFLYNGHIANPQTKCVLYKINIRTKSQEVIWKDLHFPFIAQTWSGKTIAGVKKNNKERVELWLLDLQKNSQARYGDSVGYCSSLTWSPNALCIGFIGMPSHMTNQEFGNSLFIAANGKITRLVSPKAAEARDVGLGWTNNNRIRFVYRVPPTVKWKGIIGQISEGDQVIADADVTNGHVKPLIKLSSIAGHGKSASIIRATWTKDGAGIIVVDKESSAGKTIKEAYWIKPDGTLEGRLISGKSLFCDCARDGTKAVICADGELAVFRMSDKRVRKLPLQHID